MWIVPSDTDVGELEYAQKHWGNPTDPQKLLFAHSDSGWMNDQLWDVFASTICKRVREPGPNSIPLEDAVVFLIDCALSHMSHTALRTFKQHNIEVIFIPARGTGKLQV